MAGYIYTNRLGLTVQLQYTHILQNYHFSLTLNFLHDELHLLVHVSRFKI